MRNFEISPGFLTALVILAAFGSALAGGYGGYNLRNQEVASWKQVYDETRPQWFSGSEGVTSFQMVSLDKGKTWWECEMKDANSPVIIKGPAKETHLAQLEQIKHLDEMFKKK